MTTNNNGYPWWARMLTDSIKSFGITTVIVCVLLWVTVEVVIPEMVKIANRYCTAVETSQQAIVVNLQQMVDNHDRIVSTQEQLVAVVEEVSMTAKEIISCEQASQEFMRVVQDQHDQQMQKLESIETTVKSPP